MNGLKITVAAAAIASTAVVGPAALGTASASALALSCKASMADATPKPGTRPIVRVTSAAGTALSVVVRFPGGATTTSGTVPSTGTGRVAVPAKGQPGVSVRVEVKARKGSARASCVTAFQPGGLPGTRPAVPPRTRPSATAVTAPESVADPRRPTARPTAPAGLDARTSSTTTTVRGTDAITDLYGAFVGLDVNCWYGQNTVDLSVLALSDTPTYYRSFKLWVYDHNNGVWSEGRWTEPMIGNTAFVKSLPLLADGWYTGYLEYAAWDGSQWHTYGTYGNHFHGLMYGSPLTGSTYQACHS